MWHQCAKVKNLAHHINTKTHQIWESPIKRQPNYNFACCSHFHLNLCLHCCVLFFIHFLRLFLRWACNSARFPLYQRYRHTRIHNKTHKHHTIHKKYTISTLGSSIFLCSIWYFCRITDLEGSINWPKAESVNTNCSAMPLRQMFLPILSSCKHV